MTATHELVDQLAYLEQRYARLLGLVRAFADAHQANREVWEMLRDCDPDTEFCRRILRRSRDTDDAYNDAVVALLDEARR